MDERYGDAHTCAGSEPYLCAAVLSSLLLLVPFAVTTGALPHAADVCDARPDGAMPPLLTDVCADAVYSVWWGLWALAVAVGFTAFCAVPVCYTLVVSDRHAQPYRVTLPGWACVCGTPLTAATLLYLGAVMLASGGLRAPVGVYHYTHHGVAVCNATTTDDTAAALPSGVEVDCAYFVQQYVHARRPNATASVAGAVDTIECPHYVPYACYETRVAMACRFVAVNTSATRDGGGEQPPRIVTPDTTHLRATMTLVVLSVAVTALLVLGAGVATVHVWWRQRRESCADPASPLAPIVTYRQLVP